MNNFEEWENSLEGILYNLKTVLAATVGEEQDTIIIAKTLERLPEDVRSKVIEKVTFIVMGCSKFHNWFFIKTKDEMTEKTIKGLSFFEFTIPVIVLNLTKCKDDIEKMDTVAHEISHYILGHDDVSLDVHKNYEREADNLTVEWGFNRSYKEKDLKVIDKSIHNKQKNI